MLTTCRSIRILRKNFCTLPSKDVKTFFIEELCCHIASYTIQLVTAGNTVNSYLTSTADKTYHGPVLKCLLQFFYLRRRCPSNQHFFLLLMICSDYAANYNAQRAFVIIFFICSYLLNCIRSVFTIVIRTENGVFIHSLYGHPRNFKFKQKYQQYGPCFQIIFPFLMPMIIKNILP